MMFCRRIQLAMASLVLFIGSGANADESITVYPGETLELKLATSGIHRQLIVIFVDGKEKDNLAKAFQEGDKAKTTHPIVNNSKFAVIVSFYQAAGDPNNNHTLVGQPATHEGVKLPDSKGFTGVWKAPDTCFKGEKTKGSNINVFYNITPTK